ncbi:CCA tRNA nucleotidyltransferase [Xanthovirga aplysinae]|uniref:CCA tRNA nucleotidyltransferase n=1 Tax=Xanthovirga aplysinae TaxID=2529853 RepID=UPI0012BC103B|nr:HD domain-containing protein [Xanthovirga aplysinae]MTI30463.1 HD domain-containing protein [Xanthovirga aplysinae]
MNYKDRLENNRIFEIVKKSAKELAVESYVIGGFVRDIFLQRSSKDIDIVCLGSGIELAKKVAEKLGREVHVSVFKNFGTAMLKFQEWEVEFVGARKESYKRDSRKPIVEDGSLQDDQNRRDFTINALALSLNEDDYGELIDPFDGIQALKKKIIKTPLDPEITFSDDPLRIMRAIRFASQLGFDIAPETFDAIVNHVERLEIVSRERITDELNKIILSPKPSYGFQLMFHSGVLKQIFPEMVALHGVEKIKGKGHKDNFYHTLEVLDNVAKVSGDLWLRWAAILHDIAKPQTKRFDQKVGWTFHGHEDKGARMVPQLFRKMKLPLNEKMKYVQKLVRLHLRPIALVKDFITDSAIRRLLFEAGDDVDALMILCRADVTSKNHEKVKRYLGNFDKVDAKMKELEEKDKIRNFQPVITGEIIMETFQLKPCKIVGEIKEELKEAVLEGLIKNEYEEAFKFMLKMGKERGLEPK